MRHAAGTILILVTGICAILATMAIALLVRVRSTEAFATSIQNQAQARICLNAAMAYLCDDINTSTLAAMVQTSASALSANYRPAIRIPLATDRATSLWSGWFRIYYSSSSGDSAATLGGSFTVPLWHEFIVTVGGGGSRGMRAGEMDGEPGSLQPVAGAVVELTRKDEWRYWYRVRVAPPLWHHGEPFIDTNRDGRWQPGEPFWVLHDPAVAVDGRVWQSCWPYVDLSAATTVPTDQSVRPDSSYPYLYLGATATRHTLTTSPPSPAPPGYPYPSDPQYLYDETLSPVFRGWGISLIEPLPPLGDAQVW